LRLIVVVEATIDLNWIVTFVRVVEAGSFTAAARALGVPTSSASRTLAKLEDALSVRLLHRTTRQLRLTDAGRAYYERAGRAAREMTDASRDIKEQRDTPRGVVRVTLPVDLSSSGFSDIIVAFQRRHPQIVLDVTVTNARIDLVKEGIDVALRATDRLDDSTLVARKVMAAELGFFAAPSYLRGRPKPLRLADLRKHRCILLKPPGRSTAWRFAGPLGPEELAVEPAMWVDDMGFCRHVLIAGGGVGILAEPSTRRDVTSGALVRVLPRYALGASSLYLVTPPLQHAPARVRLLCDFIFTELRREFGAYGTSSKPRA
jgi:DNA-binding transcriptional LysR family regulator